MLFLPDLLECAKPACCCAEQGVASAPLWDEEQGVVIGMISASDFIHVLRRLRSRSGLSSMPCIGSRVTVSPLRP